MRLIVCLPSWAVRASDDVLVLQRQVNLTRPPLLIQIRSDRQMDERAEERGTARGERYEGAS